jgi:CheY-like chemotaxis protein
VNLNEIVTDIDTLLRTTTGEQISLEINLAPGLFPTKADRGQLEQVVANLAVNARDAMPDGGTLTIRTRNLSNSGAELPRDFATGSYVCLEVGDTGTGMTEETIARAFEPFFTTKARGEGTGLGLATVYGIVQQTGGYVTAHSSPGNGSTFYVYLPATAEKEGPPPEIPSELVSALGGGQTILVAEDEDGVRAVVERVLTTHGYRVIVATSGEEAIALARSHDGPIDVLLTDVVMPKMSGTELADALAEERDSMPVIFMSGYTEEIASRTGGLGDPDNFLPKPFTREQLLAKLHALLEHTVG